MDYCEIALKLLGKKFECGGKCPMIAKCPRLILEDATDIAINQAIDAMLEVIGERTKSGPSRVGG